MHQFKLASPHLPPRSVVVIGTGLVGSAIVDALNTSGASQVARFETSWFDRDRLMRQVEHATRCIHDGSPRSVDWVWSAGVAGFSASAEVANREYALFESVIETISRTSACFPESWNRIHLMSSAGGLFEGLRCVDSDTAPAADRPYTRLKLAQEARAVCDFGTEGVVVHRLSSVYGYLAPGRRLGLVTAMIANTLLQRTTPIHGRMDTLRDYVFADDIGRFIVETVLADDLSPSQCHVLASARPVSIHNMRAVIQRVTGRPSYVRFVSADNAADITFLPGALPDGFRPSSLEASVRRIYQRALSADSAFSR